MSDVVRVIRRVPVESLVVGHEIVSGEPWDRGSVIGVAHVGALVVVTIRTEAGDENGMGYPPGKMVEIEEETARG